MKKTLVSTGTTNFKNTKVPGKLSLLITGDVHLGHRNTPTPNTLTALYSLLGDNEETRNLDYFIIEGDLFDRLLTNNYEHLSAIQTWMIWTLTTCKKYDIALRVLEGTPSHDMKQSEAFVTFNSAYDIGCDLRYVETLSIERDEKRNVTFLYLPDEWTSPIENCYIEAQRLLIEEGLDLVDFAVMHGAFSYQLPKGMGIPTHDMESWLSLVRYHIFIGHHHDYSQYDRIIAAGSLDRGKHGEEGPKGYIRYSLTEDGASIRFIENKYAKIYKTIDCYGMTPSDIVEYVERTVKEYPKGSSIRLRGMDTDHVAAAEGYMKLSLPDYQWDSLIERSEKAVIIESAITELNYTPIHLTRDNLPRLLYEKLITQGYTTEQSDRAIGLLKRTMGV